MSQTVTPAPADEARDYLYSQIHVPVFQNMLKQAGVVASSPEELQQFLLLGAQLAATEQHVQAQAGNTRLSLIKQANARLAQHLGTQQATAAFDADVDATVNSLLANPDVVHATLSLAH
jgi:hypothetical protein